MPKRHVTRAQTQGRTRNPLAAMLRDRRRGHGLTVRDVARESGVSIATVSRVERGHAPDVSTALALARWLGVSVEYAMTGTDSRPACSRCVHSDFVLAGIRADLAALNGAPASPEFDEGASE